MEARDDTIGRSLDRLWPAIAYSAIPPLLLAGYLTWGAQRHFGGNWSALFYFGGVWAEGGALPHDPIIRAGPGYDGEFYYRVARDPFLPIARLWGRQTSSRVPGMDTPLYRYRRIAYPMIARLAALNTRDGLVWSFPLVSVLSLWLGVFSMARLFDASGWPGWWGMSYALLPGLVFAASRNLCDGLAAALVCASLLAFRRRRTLTAVALLTVAHLTHETTVLISIGCFLSVARSRRRWREAVAYLVPGAVTLLWSVVVASAFGGGVTSVLSSSAGAVGIGSPFAGIWHKLHWLVDPDGAPEPYASLPTSFRFWFEEAFLVLPILIALPLLLRAAWSRKGELWVTGLLASLFVLACNDVVWQDAASYTRVATIALLLALRSVAESPDPLGHAFLASLPLGTLGALGWCWDSWRGWSLGP